MLIYLASIGTESGKSKFVQLYEAYQGLMFHTAFRLLRQPEDAEDAVHEAFLYLAKNISKISEPVSQKTKAYVVLIVESRAIDQLRRRKRRPTVPLEDWQGIETQPQGDDHLADCMLRLPAAERQVLWLKYYHGYELKEMGPMLGLSYDAVARLHRKAKDHLRELYEEERSQ